MIQCAENPCLLLEPPQPLLIFRRRPAAIAFHTEGARDFLPDFGVFERIPLRDVLTHPLGAGVYRVRRANREGGSLQLPAHAFRARFGQRPEVGDHLISQTVLSRQQNPMKSHAP